MLELGNLLSVFAGARAVDATEKRISSSVKPPRTRMVPDTDAAIADIRYAQRFEKEQQEDSDIRPQLINKIPIEEVIAAIRERLDKFKELIESIRTNSLSADNLSEELDALAGSNNGIATAKRRVYSDVSELLAHFREEISEIQSFDGFLLGVHDKIEQFRPQAEFDLNQVRDVEAHMAEVNSSLELGIFSLARVREQALRALRCQGDPEPERVLKLLEDDTKKPDVAAPVLPDENTAEFAGEAAVPPITQPGESS